MKKDFEDEHHAKSILLWRSPGKIDSANGEMRVGVCVRMPRGPAVSDFFNSLLVDKLGAIGVSETEPNIRTKISRGGFTGVFFVQCLVAIGCESLRL